MERAPHFQWRGVPISMAAEWRRAFSESARGCYLDGNCPLCGKQALCRYFHRDHADLAKGSAGAIWEWCSWCGAYEHGRSLVPVGWERKPLDLDHSILGPIPSSIDARLEPLGEFEFSFRKMAVGVFTNHGGLPLAPGVFRYQAFRGPGHHELQTALELRLPGLCLLSWLGGDLEFVVEAITEDGRLVVG